MRAVSGKSFTLAALSSPWWNNKNTPGPILAMLDTLTL
jgi:hypothetical protein